MTSTEKHVALWEILVPTMMIPRKQITTLHHGVPEPSEILETHHQAWDEKVAKITKGLTLMPHVRGKWKDSLERSIPVRIACTAEEMKHIAEITMDHYNQDAILYWLVSGAATILEKGP